MYNDSVAEVFNILATSRSCGNMQCSYQNFQPRKVSLQVSVLIIKYLVATPYELWMMSYVLYFVALITVAAKTVIEKSGVCV